MQNALVGDNATFMKRKYNIFHLQTYKKDANTHSTIPNLISDYQMEANSTHDMAVINNSQSINQSINQSVSIN
jgi:hypothetical protein